jgi:uncharacterized protein
MGRDHYAQFAGQKYLNLESYRKTGQPVRTPLWFAEDDNVFYAYSLADSFKIKRMRNNPQVRIAPCDMRGKVKGEWVDATARILNEAGVQRTHELLNQKYGLLKRAAHFLARLRGHKHAAFAIEINS